MPILIFCSLYALLILDFIKDPTSFYLFCSTGSFFFCCCIEDFFVITYFSAFEVSPLLLCFAFERCGCVAACLPKTAGNSIEKVTFGTSWY